MYQEVIQRAGLLNGFDLIFAGLDALRQCRR
jgi:hypothetical protein